MYAIFEDGSRQYRVEQGSTVVVDYREAEPGQTLEFNRVLLVAGGAGATVGQPLVPGAKVVSEVVDLPAKKSMIQHFRRRKNYRRLKGHTQPYVRVKVKEIVAG